MPDLVQVARKYEKDAAVLLVSYDLQLAESSPAGIEEAVRRFVEQRGWGLPVHIAQDPSAMDTQFALPGPIPVTLAFDREGRLVDREEGSADAARFEAMLRLALGG